MNEIYTDDFCHFGKKINIAAVYPNSYKFGIANLGHQTFYRLINLSSDINCERIYIENNFSDNLCSVETSKKIQNFDVIAVSVCYELDIYNIINLLKKYNWYDSVLNKKYENRPLIIVGGSMTFINPRILAKYSDYTICGDFENIVSPFCDFIKCALNSKDAGHLKKQYSFLYDEEKIKYNTSNMIEAYSTIIPDEKNDAGFPNTFLVELARGCPNNCVFCNTGATRNPLRFFDRNRLDKLINFLAENNIPKIGFIGSAVLLYPDLKNILYNLLKLNIQFSFSSLTINQLDEEIIELLVKTGQHTITLAPEVGNDKMRKLINKKIDMNKFYELFKFSVASGIKRIKLYFLYGFEEDDADDIYSIIELINEIKLITKKSGRPFNLLLSFNPVIPKPNTPYFEKIMLSKKTLVRKKKILRAKLINSGARLEFMSINEAIVQYQIANDISWIR